MHQSIARRLSAGTDIRLAALQLVAQQLAEQVVVAIPLALPVERHDEAVPVLQRLERVGGSRRLQHDVAETAAHAVEHGRVLEKLRLDRRQPRQQLEAEVLGHEPVASGEARGARRARPAGLHRQRREVQAGGPAFRLLGQLGELGRVQLDAGRFEQQLGLSLVQPEVRHADLLHQAMRPPAAERQRWILPARDRDLRAGGNVLDQRREHVETGRTGDGVQVVEHQHQRALERTKCAPDPRDAVRPGRSAWTRQRLEHLGRDRLDAVNRGRDVSQEHHRVVVSAVERDPREGTRIGLGPLRKQRRLAVTGRGDHGRERQGRRAQTGRSRPPSPRCPAGATGAASLTSTRSKGTSARAIARPILRGRRPSLRPLFHTSGMRRTRVRTPRVGMRFGLQ